MTFSQFSKFVLNFEIPAFFCVIFNFQNKKLRKKTWTKIHVKRMEENQRFRVIFESDGKDHPFCPHGPMILYERITEKGKVTRFHACSAFRDKRKCGQSQITARSKFLENPSGFCSTCQELISDVSKHKAQNHEIVTKDLDKPLTLLQNLEDSKSQAQYHFSQESLEVILKIVNGQNPDLVICIGAPTVFLNLKKKTDKILLDIDHRLSPFIQDFCHYNMFNHHFFEEESKDLYLSKIKSKQNVIVITDPPFGGRPELIGKTLKMVMEDLGSTLKYHFLWIFPYYMEHQIQKLDMKIQMSDYQVTYDQNSNYRQGHAQAGKRKLGSPVRIFTNLPLNQIILDHLPSSYRHCQTCDIYVSLTNRHCSECLKCTGKNGGLYKHCYECSRCVKHSWKHCDTCDRCTLPDHECCTASKKRQKKTWIWKVRLSQECVEFYERGGQWSWSSINYFSIWE